MAACASSMRMIHVGVCVLLSSLVVWGTMKKGKGKERLHSWYKGSMSSVLVRLNIKNNPNKLRHLEANARVLYRKEGIAHAKKDLYIDQEIVQLPDKPHPLAAACLSAQVAIWVDGVNAGLSALSIVVALSASIFMARLLSCYAKHFVF
eukprot:1156746-Pelagomonas_calceolata.AAC.8